MSLKDPLSPKNLPDFDPELENDAVWKVLDEASPAKIPPRFTSDTLRRLRLENEVAKSRWWQKLLSPKPLVAASATALAAVAIVLSLPDEPTPVPAQTVDSQPTDSEPSSPAAVEDWDNLEDSLARELLSGAAEDPTLLSDEEIVSLLF